MDRLLVASKNLAEKRFPRTGTGRGLEVEGHRNSVKKIGVVVDGFARREVNERVLARDDFTRRIWRFTRPFRCAAARRPDAVGLQRVQDVTDF